MDPVTMMVLGGVLTGGGMFMQSQDRKKQLEREAEIGRLNARTIRNAGRFNAMRQEVIGAQAIGATEASFAAAGVSSDSVSALEVLRQSHTNAELDRLGILYEAETRAFDAENRANMADSAAGRQDMIGLLSASGALLSSGAKYA